MMDVVDRKTRSRMMRGIGSRNTKPELLIRKRLFGMGFRYRVNDRKIFGSPDIVFPKYHAVVFIHGCFWHGHDCEIFKLPGTRTEFWKEKIEVNRERDAKVLNQLRAEGWRICIVWECAVKGKAQLQRVDITVSKIAEWVRSEYVWMEIERDS
ncbi:MAG: DNA mismatch endonuclease Vsr [Spirochaetes bacterium]|nr:DNA mismatch endonuclease Vsr [Spirochaetota bacterium]